MSSLFLATLAVSIAFPFAWGFDAHRFICEIAWREMTPRTRTEITALLALDTEYTTFADACTWADAASRTREYAEYRTAHYMNVVPDASRVSVQRDCAVSICVLEAIEAFSEQLRDRDRSGNERLVALKFLSHLVGDLHQPLHVAYEEDRGGNSRHVTLNGRTYNLHEVWDRLLVEDADGWHRRATELHNAIDPIDRAAWGATDPVSWANESFFLVVNDVYPDLVRDTITEEYIIKHRRTASTRIAQAGLRLGALLNRLLRTDGR